MKRSKTHTLALSLGIVALAACDKGDATPQSTPAASTTSTTASGPASASATVSSAPPAPAPPLVERPIPKPAHTVGATMPSEVQLKAISYMAAMRSPRPGDSPAEPDYAEALAKKLDPILRGAGPSIAGEKNRAVVVAGGRQIDIFTGQGCDDTAPMRFVVQRGATRLSTLRDRGVLVVRCNDAHIQCLQSTRDESDVLCTTAPRHGKP